MDCKSKCNTRQFNVGEISSGTVELRKGNGDISMSIEIQQKIVEWGEDKGIVYPDNAVKQYLKFVEKKGELAREILCGDVEAAKMELGDCIVTVTLLRACTHDFNHVLEFDFSGRNQQRLLVTLEAISGRIASGIELGLSSDVYHDYIDIAHPRMALSVLAALAESVGSTFEECATLAYQKISKRKGANVNGVFVKEEEPKESPFCDYVGRKVFECDRIVHPCGDAGIVIITDDEGRGKNYEWKVKYDDGTVLWLGNQIDLKGQGVVVKEDV